MSHLFSDINRAPKQGLHLRTSDLVWHRFYLSCDAVACIVDHNVELMKVLLDVDECSLDAADVVHVEGEDEELRGGVLRLEGDEGFGSGGIAGGGDDAVAGF